MIEPLNSQSRNDEMEIGTQANTLGISDSLSANDGQRYGKGLYSIYHFEHRNAEDELLWEETRHNLVTTEGLNDSLTKHFKGASYTASWAVGITTGSPTFAAGDTMASHPGWTESTAYTGSRPTLTLGTASAGSIDNSASKAVFTANANATWGGAFVVSNADILYGGAALSADRAVVPGDTLTVTVTLTATAA